MSNKAAKEIRSKAKDARQEPIIEADRQKRRSRKKKNYVVEYKAINPVFDFDREWAKWNSYSSEEIASKAMSQLEVKYSTYADFRLRDKG